MLQNRIMPCLTIKDKKLVKTQKFKHPKYIGDPVNAIKIFNQKEVDELIVVDISENRLKSGPDLEMIRQIANECFMPVAYGGGISTIEQIQEILKIGIEKVAINTVLRDDFLLIEQAADKFGSQCVIAVMDIKKNWLNKYQLRFDSDRQSNKSNIVAFANQVEASGAGEILINNIDRDGTWLGFDLDLIKMITSSVSIPVITLGGAGHIDHIKDAIKIGKASAVAISSMAVYQSKGMGVLINFPKPSVLEEINNLQ